MSRTVEVRHRGQAYRIVVSQLALSFMLLIGAALMLRSFAKLQQVDAGFRTENVLTLTLDLNWAKYTNPERRVDRARVLGVIESLWERVRALPGVVTTGSAWTLMPLVMRSMMARSSSRLG